MPCDLKFLRDPQDVLKISTKKRTKVNLRICDPTEWSSFPMATFWSVRILIFSTNILHFFEKLDYNGETKFHIFDAF